MFSPSQWDQSAPKSSLLIYLSSQLNSNHYCVPSSYLYQSRMNHQTSSVPQIAYQSPQVSTQLMTESPFMDSGFAVPIFSSGDDLIACLNKAMAFLTAVDSSRFPLINNQLRTSSNPRNQATIQDGRVIMQQVQERQGQGYSSTGYKSNATSFGGNNASRQARDKAMLAEAHEVGQILDEEQLAFLTDPGVLDGQPVQTIIPNNAAFQTEDLDTYDSDCDDISNAKAVLMGNISKMVSTLSQSSHEKMIDSQMDDMIKEKLALKEQVDSLKQNLSKQIKEKECLLQTFMVLKNESKVKENKYMENEIDLEKKIKELDNIIFKVGQSAQTVHMLTKPQPFYDGIVISDKHVAMPVIDDEETLNLKRFTPQQELSVEQAFWLRMSNPTSKPSDASPIKIEAPKELPKNKDYTLMLVKRRIGLNYKICFNNEIIAFLKSLKAIFNVFDRDLINEIMEVQTVFDQMDVAVQ
ncbi:hypothetical protein Tco_0339604 [Tanacetum coccineum]